MAIVDVSIARPANLISNGESGRVGEVSIAFDLKRVVAEEPGCRRSGASTVLPLHVGGKLEPHVLENDPHALDSDVLDRMERGSTGAKPVTSLVT
ncbi:MAG: hypothetical protein AAF645_30070, partial [Myxococcota bacterium]